MKHRLRGVTALTIVATLTQPALTASLPLVTTQPDPPADVAPYFVGDTDPRWTGPEWSADDIAALRQKVKYVFVIFNENRSFDHEYGTLPGVNGLYSDGKNPRPSADTPGFTESYLDTNTGETVSVQPFRVGPEQNSTIKDSTDHSHPGLAAKMDVQNGVAKMDKFAEVEWRKYARAGRRSARSDGQAVRAPRHGAYRLRHHPVLLALCEPLHHLRQQFRHRRHALHAKRGRRHRRPIGRDTVGKAPERNPRTPPRTASPGRSAARSTARPIPERRPR